MSSQHWPPASGKKKVQSYGNGVYIAIDKAGLRDLGVDPEEIQGEEIPTKLSEDGQFIADVSAVLGD